MAILARTLSKQLISHIKELEYTRSNMEALVVSGHINISDIERVYSGLYLSLFTEFEGTIETLFLGLLSGKYYSRSHNIHCNLKIKPSTMTQIVVFEGRFYADWLPYDTYTLQRANRFFLNGIPFTLLSNNQLHNLKEYCKIRNAIAHKSDKANRDFQSMISHLPLLPQERTPAGYLRSKPSSLQTQYEIASLELESIARFLCS